MNLNEQMIELVRDRKCLYNPRSAEYKDRGKKSKAWEEISLCTGLTGNIFQRWNVA